MEGFWLCLSPPPVAGTDVCTVCVLCGSVKCECREGLILLPKCSSGEGSLSCRGWQVCAGVCAAWPSAVGVHATECPSLCPEEKYAVRNSGPRAGCTTVVGCATFLCCLHYRVFACTPHGQLFPRPIMQVMSTWALRLCGVVCTPAALACRNSV